GEVGFMGGIGNAGAEGAVAEHPVADSGNGGGAPDGLMEIAGVDLGSVGLGVFLMGKSHGGQQQGNENWQCFILVHQGSRLHKYSSLQEQKAQIVSYIGHLRSLVDGTVPAKTRAEHKWESTINGRLGFRPA